MFFNSSTKKEPRNFVSNDISFRRRTNIRNLLKIFEKFRPIIVKINGNLFNFQSKSLIVFLLSSTDSAPNLYLTNNFDSIIFRLNFRLFYGLIRPICIFLTLNGIVLLKYIFIRNKLE